QGTATLRLRLLLLPPRELLQLLQQLVELLIAVLLHRAIGGLVLVRHAIELELEEVGQLLRHLAAAATPAASVAARADLCLVLFLGLLQEPERAVLRRQRAIGARGPELRLGLLHLGDGLREELGDLLERRVRLDETGVHALREP